MAATTAATTVSGRRRLSLQTRDALLGVALIAPAAGLFCVLIVYPLIYGVGLAFQSIQLITLRGRFVGLDNFVQLLAPGSEFYRALWIGVQWTGGALVLQILLGILVALLLNQEFYGRSLARGLAIFPYVVPVIVAVTVWKWMFNDLYGIVNYTLLGLGLIRGPILWLSSPGWALMSVILVSTWRLFPFVVIAVLGRLQTIPQQLYDAARTDGASNWALFWDITLPQLRSVLIVTVLLRAIWDFNDFNLIGLLTGGGPAGGTQTLPVLVYVQAFGQQRVGLAAATADMALVVLTIFFAVYFWVIRRTDEAPA